MVPADPPASLSEHFLSALQARGLTPPGASDALERALAAAADSARTAWPQIAPDRAGLARALGDKLESEDLGEPLAALAQVRAADLTLALACARGEPVALRLFEEQFLARVPALVRRLDPSGTLGAEVAQELREKLLVAGEGGPRIADYSGRGDLLGWLRVVALRAALKLRRAQRRHGLHALGEREHGADLLDGADPERDYLRLRYQGEYEAAFRAALQSLHAPERLLLKLHHVDGLSLPRLAALYRVHRATIARRLADHRRKLLETTKALLRDKLRLSESEFESLLVLVRSQLGVGLRSALSK